MSYWGQELYDPNLIALWKLDETEGEVAYDSAGENDATVIGDGIWQPEAGQIGGTLQFDGVDDYLTAPFVLDPIKQPFSVFAWIKGGQPGQTIISQQGAFGEWLSVDPAGILTTSLTFPLPAITSNVVITDDLWHHIGVGEFCTVPAHGRGLQEPIVVTHKAYTWPPNSGIYFMHGPKINRKPPGLFHW